MGFLVICITEFLNSVVCGVTIRNQHGQRTRNDRRGKRGPGPAGKTSGIGHVVGIGADIHPEHPVGRISLISGSI